MIKFKSQQQILSPQHQNTFKAISSIFITLNHQAEQKQIPILFASLYYQFSLFYVGVSEYYMNQNYCVIDYFDADIQPSSAHYFLSEPQRKPSYDDLLNGLLATQQDQTPAQATQQSPKLKGRRTKLKTSSQNKIRRQVNTNKTVAEGMQRGHWGQQENKRYHWFLELHCQHFLNKHLRRMDKIFKTMEKFVKSRQAEQCRSHHQKMQKKYGNFINILKHLRLQLNQAGDAQFVATEMKNNGVQLNTQLLSWQMLQCGITHCLQKQDMGCTSVEVSPCSQRFTDPLAQLECECILQLLIL